MRCAVIKPAEKIVVPVEARAPHDACTHAGLKRVAHAIARRPDETCAGFGIFVAKNSMFVDPMQQQFFAIGRKLFAGNAVAYGLGEFGTTVDVPIDVIRPEWFQSANYVELAIRDGRIDRPQRVIRGQIVWQWPDRQPPAY